MKLKKSKRLAKERIQELMQRTMNLVENMETTKTNQQLEEKLIEIKSISIELIDYYINNCSDETQRIKDKKARDTALIKRPNIRDIIKNEH